MKKYLFFVLPLLVVACSRPATRFVLHGYVPGAQDSTLVELRSEDRDISLVGYVLNGEFELMGEAPVASHCRLSMNNQDAANRSGKTDGNAVKYVETDFFVENGGLTFRTPHIDSLPQSFWRYDIQQEKNYTLKGSVAQDVYFRYQQQTISLRYAIRTLDRAYMKDGRIEDFKTLQEKTRELEAVTKAFIREQGNLAVNLYLAQGLKKEPFTYDADYVDELAGLFASCQDTCAALKRFRQETEDARAFVQGKALQAGEIVIPAGKRVPLLAQLKKGRYTVIDFWASWCGPCRASFPHLREMYKHYGAKATFISISVDKNEKDWNRALREEELPWSQFLATPELSKSARTDYNLTSIPTFLVVDPEGKIIFSGHSSGELETLLESICNI